jgi:hypothetical protein
MLQLGLDSVHETKRIVWRPTFADPALKSSFFLDQVRQRLIRHCCLPSRQGLQAERCRDGVDEPLEVFSEACIHM